MTLSSLWITNRDQFEGKRVDQVIAFTADGKLRDENATSKEFREFLSRVPSQQIQQYLDQCLADGFEDSGLVLQDLVNQIGKRLSFKVQDGRYRGVRGQLGSDGLWTFPDGHVVIVEVKTTDTYQIDLDTLANYRRQVISRGDATEDNSSILIVLGRGDGNTSILESQIRGSRYAWNIRILSAHALTRLMQLKETVEDPSIIKRISNILIPKEFTKLDEIIDLVFSTAEDVKEDSPAEIDGDETDQQIANKAAPVSFHDACAHRLEGTLGQALLKQSKTTYSTADDAIRLSCAVSREYVKGNHIGYWFAFHDYQEEFLHDSSQAYAAFGCGTAQQLMLFPFAAFSKWLKDMNTTENDDRIFWHVHISRHGEKFTLVRKGGGSPIDLSPYLVK